MRLWVVMCPHKRKERFWGINTSSVRGWMVQVKGEAWGEPLKEPGPSDALSLQLSSPKRFTHFMFLCFRVLLSWETSSDPCQHEDQCSITLLGTLLWVLLTSCSANSSPTAATGTFFCHIQPRVEQFFSCLASGEEQTPTVRIFNTLYYPPPSVNCGLPGPTPASLSPSSVCTLQEKIQF